MFEFKGRYQLKHSETFSVNLDNVPLINLRNEFNTYLSLLNEKEFRSQLEGTVIKPIKTPYLIWGGMRNDFYTFTLQRAILGVESYLPAAVFIEMGMHGSLNRDNAKFINNPWLLGGRSVVDNFYHKLPSMLGGEFSLKLYSNSLWEGNCKFYKEIRNPIFHGHQFSKVDLDSFTNLYEHIACLYDWIDSWHEPENIIEGGNTLSRAKRIKSSN